MAKISAIDKLVPAPENGADGKPAVSYFMTASRTAITVNRGSMPDINSIIVRGWKIVGNAAPVEVKYTYQENHDLADMGGGYAKRGYLPCTIQMYDLLQDFDHGLSCIHFDMFLPNTNNKVAASIDIAFIYNGTDGKDGKDGTSFTVKGNAVECVGESEDIDRSIVGNHLVSRGSNGTPEVITVKNDMSVSSSTPELGDAYIIDSRIFVALATRWEDLGEFRGPQGAVGPQGPQGDAGPQGPMAYLAGEWQRNVTYTRDKYSMPVVRYNEAYWYLKKETSVLGSEPNAKSLYWELLMENDIVFAKIVMTEFGKLASAVFSGAYMLSQYGKLNGQTVDGNSSVKDTAYTNFSASNPEGGAFVPNLFINFLTGYLCAMNAKIKGEIEAERGSIAGWRFSQGQLGSKDYGMSLSDSLIQFVGNNMSALFGLWDNLGYPTMQVLENIEPNSVGKCGIHFNLRGAVGHPNFAFKGNGDGVLNGLVTGYSYETLTLPADSFYQIGDGIQPLKSNKIYIKALVSTPYLMLPSLHVMRDTLAVEESTPFSVRLTLMAEIGSEAYRVYGRNKVKTGSRLLWDNDNYPVLTDYDANNYEFKSMAKGDCMEVELCYNPSITATVGGYSAKYTARILNINT